MRARVNDTDDSHSTDSSLDRIDTAVLEVERMASILKALYITKKKSVVIAYAKKASFIRKHSYCVAIVCIACFSSCCL